MTLIPARVPCMPDGPCTALPVQSGTASAGDSSELGGRPQNRVAGKGGLTIAARVPERLGGVSITHGMIGQGETWVCASLPGDADVPEGRPLHRTVAPSGCHVFAASARVA